MSSQFYMNEEACAIVSEAESITRVLARLFSTDYTDSIERGVTIKGDDLFAVQRVLEVVAEKLLDLKLESCTLPTAAIEAALKKQEMGATSNGKG